MKAHGNYTTTVMTAIWLRLGATALLTLAALILGVMVLWRTNGQATLPTSTSDSFARHVSDPIAPCRACRDEWVAAQAAPATIIESTSGADQRPQSADALSVSRANALIASCRACRDEWIAAQAVQPAVALPAQRPRAPGATTVFRTAGPITSCRACRDEWLAAQEAIIPTGGVTFDQPEEYIRISGPR
jgi:hypothetical protein